MGKRLRLGFEKTSLSDTRPQDPFGWSHGSLIFGDGEGLLLVFTSACSGQQAEQCRRWRAECLHLSTLRAGCGREVSGRSPEGHDNLVSYGNLLP
jgi:hypothetical protein